MTGLSDCFLRHLPCSPSQSVHLLHLSEKCFSSVYSTPSWQSTHIDSPLSDLQSPSFRVPAQEKNGASIELEEDKDMEQRGICAG